MPWPAASIIRAPRTGGRVVECTALEMRRRCKPSVSSNLTLSANSQAIPMDFYFAARAFPLLFPLCLMPPDQGQLARPARTIRRAFKAPTTWLPSQSARASTVPQNRPKPDPPTGYPPNPENGTYGHPAYDFAQPIQRVGIKRLLATARLAPSLTTSLGPSKSP